MSDDTYSDAQSYTAALGDIIARYIQPEDYEVKLEKNHVKVKAGQRKFSLPAVVLNNQDLAELDLALREAKRSGGDAVEELAVQLSHLEESAAQLGYLTDSDSEF